LRINATSGTFLAIVATARNRKPIRYRVRRDENRAVSPWICDFHAYGKRQRHFFASEELARAEGERLSSEASSIVAGAALGKGKSVKLSVSLQAHHIAFIQANLAIFGSTSGAITRALNEMIDRVERFPAAYTLRPVVPRNSKHE